MLTNESAKNTPRWRVSQNHKNYKKISNNKMRRYLNQSRKLSRHKMYTLHLNTEYYNRYNRLLLQAVQIIDRRRLLLMTVDRQHTSHIKHT